MANAREYLCLEQREGKAKGDSSPKVKYKSQKHPCHNSRKD